MVDPPTDELPRLRKNAAAVATRLDQKAWPFWESIQRAETLRQKPPQ